MEIQQPQKVTFDPKISGYNEEFWSTILGTPSVVADKIRLAAVGATKAVQTLALTGVIVPGSHAESVVTANTVIDGNIVTIGETVYRAKTTPAQAYDVALGASDAIFLDNLKKAINASGLGDGTDYYAGTLAHPSVVATTNADTTQKIVARIPGVAANDIATESTGGTMTWADTTLGGETGDSNPGVDPETVTIGSVVYSIVDVLSETNGAAAIANQVLFGADSAAALDNLKLAINGGATAGTNYSTGTVAHDEVTATTNTNTAQTVQSILGGTVGNAIEVDTDIGNGAWGDDTLAGGDDDGAGCEIFSYYQPTYGRVDIAVNVPTAPSVGDYRAFGVSIPSFGNRSRIEFVIDGTVLTAKAYDDTGHLVINQPVAWDGDWTATETVFSVIWTASTIKMMIGGTAVASYSSEQDTRMRRIDAPVAVHVVNGSSVSTNTDNLDIGTVSIVAHSLI